MDSNLFHFRLHELDIVYVQDSVFAREDVHESFARTMGLPTPVIRSKTHDVSIFDHQCIGPHSSL